MEIAAQHDYDFLSCSVASVDAEFRQAAHGQGRPVLSFTCNDESRLERRAGSRRRRHLQRPTRLAAPATGRAFLALRPDSQWTESTSATGC